MQPIEPGDNVVIKRTNDHGKVEKTEEGRAVVALDTREGAEHEVTADFSELSRIHEGTPKANEPG
jgi:hypothetical protein